MIKTIWSECAKYYPNPPPVPYEEDQTSVVHEANYISNLAEINPQIVFTNITENNIPNWIDSQSIELNILPNSIYT